MAGRCASVGRTPRIAPPAERPTACCVYTAPYTLLDGSARAQPPGPSTRCQSRGCEWGPTQLEGVGPAASITLSLGVGVLFAGRPVCQSHMDKLQMPDFAASMWELLWFSLPDLVLAVFWLRRGCAGKAQLGGKEACLS